MFNTLKNYHFRKLPQSFKDKAEKMIDDICPLGILYEGTIDAVKVWGRDDILLLMQAMYNETRKEKDALLEWARKEYETISWYHEKMQHVTGCVGNTDSSGKAEAYKKVIEKIESL